MRGLPALRASATMAGQRVYASRWTPPWQRSGGESSAAVATARVLSATVAALAGAACGKMGSVATAVVEWAAVERARMTAAVAAATTTTLTEAVAATAVSV